MGPLGAPWWQCPLRRSLQVGPIHEATPDAGTYFWHRRDPSVEAGTYFCHWWDHLFLSGLLAKEGLTKKML